MDGAYLISTPMVVNNFFATSSSLDITMSDLQIYRIIIGALWYVTITWLDIIFVINCTCQFMHASSE